MRILLLGDIIGKPGRQALIKALPELRRNNNLDFVIANAENLAHGFGITPDTISQMQQVGVDAFTSGNHVWDNKKGKEFLSTNPPYIVRPANYKTNPPGLGWTEVKCKGKRLLLINLLGVIFMEEKEVTSPYFAFDQIFQEHGAGHIVIVDFHAEATGEKRSFSWYADGRADIIVGTHMHVLTADEQILPKHTAYITDLGMVGAKNSSLGMDIDLVIKKNVLNKDTSIEPPKIAKEAIINGVIVEIEETTMKPSKITRVDQVVSL